MVKVIVSQSKCETTHLVIDPNDILWVSGLEGDQNCDNLVFKLCTIYLLKCINVENHIVMVHDNENVENG